MTNNQELRELKSFEARSIIENLRKGSVPIDQVPIFTVGRQKWLTSVEDDLSQYIAEGGAKVRFINGDYGDGKTHFMSIIKHLSLQNNFAVSFVVLTRDVPIHKFEVVYKELILQICGSFKGVGFRSLLDHWINDLKDNLHNTGDSSLQENIDKLSNELRELSGMDLNFANALIALIGNKYLPLAELEMAKERTESFEIICQWFEGAKIAKKNLKPFQVFESLDKTNSKLFLNSLIVFLRFLGYKGLILLVDELETLMAQSASVRNAGYENIRLLIDNTEQAQFLHIFFSIIPDVILSEKGFKSYDALWSRVRSVGESEKLNYRGILLDLHRTPLKIEELTELGVSLRQIHEIAYRWDSKDLISDELIKKICEAQQRMGLLSEVRLYIKQIIRYLDLVEQGEQLDLGESINEQISIVQKELEQEKAEHLQPKWDA